MQSKLQFYTTKTELIVELFFRLIIRISIEENPMGFGCEPTVEAPNLLLLAKSLGIEVVGVSVYFEKEVVEANIFQKAISVARTIFDFAATLQYDFDVLDFGDGFPVEEGTAFDKVSNI